MNGKKAKFVYKKFEHCGREISLTLSMKLVSIKQYNTS